MRTILTSIGRAMAVLATAGTGASTLHFYPDDPVWVLRETQEARSALSGAAARGRGRSTHTSAATMRDGRVGFEGLPGGDAAVSRGLLARTSRKAPAARVRATGE